MISLSTKQVHNAYIIETSNYEEVKNEIMRYAVRLGFDENLVKNFTHPDITYVEDIEESIKMMDIRENVINACVYPPLISDRKIFVIYDAVNLDTNIQNALLKTLEEPPEFDTFFLVTSNASKLLETVRSRCIIIKDNTEMSSSDIIKIPFADEALNILANIKYETPSDIMKFADTFDKDEEALKNLIMIYRHAIRDAFAYKKTLSKDVIYLKEKEVQITSIANALSYNDFGKYIDNLDKLSKSVGLNIDKKIAVYNFFEV